MGEFRDAMLMELELKGYSPTTKKIYLENVKAFVRYYNQPPDQLGDEDIRRYLYYLYTEKKSSYSAVNIAYNALRLFYSSVLRRTWDIKKLPRPRGKKRLPVVLDTSEVKRLFEAVINLKYRVIFMTIYSAGLRLSEAAHLRVKDIDSKRMQIRIDQGKGNKDRYAMLSHSLIKVLREYWKYYRPSIWLFPGRSLEQPIGTSSIQKMFRQAKKRAGISKPASVHTLRHSFATHLLEQGVDVFRIQKLLGHSNLNTTRIYVHIQNQGLKELVNPLDYLLSS